MIGMTGMKADVPNGRVVALKQRRRRLLHSQIPNGQQSVVAAGCYEMRLRRMLRQRLDADSLAVDRQDFGRRGGGGGRGVGMLRLLFRGAEKTEIPQFELSARVGGEKLHRSEVNDGGDGKAVGGGEAEFRRGRGGVRVFGGATSTDAQIEDVK